MQGKALTFLEGFWRELVNVSVGYCKNSVWNPKAWQIDRRWWSEILAYWIFQNNKTVDFKKVKKKKKIGSKVNMLQ